MKSKLGICQLLTSCFFFTALFFPGGRKSGEGGGGRGEGGGTGRGEAFFVDPL